MNNKAEYKTKIERFETLLEQVNINKVQLNQKLLEQKTIENGIQEEIDKYATILDGVNARINELNDKNTANNNEIQTIQRDINQGKVSLNEKQQILMRNRSKLENLRNMTERYEGFGNSINRVMEHKVKQPGIQGVGADIIKVDKKYETAVETALGGSIQKIVTDNENTAKNLIQYLKVNKYGRATFLPLTTVNSRGGFNYTSALDEKGVLGLANTLIETEDKFKNLIESLVG